MKENSNHIDETREAFNKYSDRYEDWFSKDVGKIIKKTEKKAAERLLPEGKGLEVGVGSGIFASDLGVNYGIDPAEKMLHLAKRRGVKTVLGIGEMLPFVENSFDFLLFMFSISFLKNPKKAFSEAHRVLKQNGKLIVCYIPKESPWGRFYQEKKRNNHDFYKHAHFSSKKEIRNLYKRAGFRKKKSVSTLFQKPGEVTKVEEPTAGTDGKAGLYCLSLVKN